MVRTGRRWYGGTEFVVGLVTGAAILLFVATGSAALAAVLRPGGNGSPQWAVSTALLLNIALILFGWFRHRGLADEVNSLAQASERAERLAARDPLTGFLNRRTLAEDAKPLFRLAARRNKAVAVLMLDLDHFKTVNDVHGHAMGDALLRQVAGEIQALVPPSALVARLGGDEFACCLPFDPADAPEVERLAGALVARLGRPFHADGAQLHVSGSVGLARSDHAGDEGDEFCDVDATRAPGPDGAAGGFEELLRSADIAMYAAKNAGRNRYAWFDRSMERELRARNDLERDLRAAIPAGRIVPFFEQQVDLSTGRLAGFEVSARWDHPTRGLLPPESFVSAAEETGLIGELSLSVMRGAFAAARSWDPGLTLSVGLSPVLLRDAWAAQKIIRTLAETGFPAHRLEIEVTERALFANLALTQTTVGGLKNQGVRVVLDDFGSGYSSLGHLRALPFDRIKVHRSFVASVADNAESAAIVNAVARLADSLGLPVTAAGIEDPDAEAKLRAMGCARGQGYRYGRPLGADATHRLLADRRLADGRAAGDGAAAPDAARLAG